MRQLRRRRLHRGVSRSCSNLARLRATVTARPALRRSSTQTNLRSVCTALRLAPWGCSAPASDQRHWIVIQNAAVRVAERDEALLGRADDREPVLDSAGDRHARVVPRIPHDAPRRHRHETHTALAVGARPCRKVEVLTNGDTPVRPSSREQTERVSPGESCFDPRVRLTSAHKLRAGWSRAHRPLVSFMFMRFFGGIGSRAWRRATLDARTTTARVIVTPSREPV
jgi:hypothetical protein